MTGCGKRDMATRVYVSSLYLRQANLFVEGSIMACGRTLSGSVQTVESRTVSLAK